MLSAEAPPRASAVAKAAPGVLQRAIRRETNRTPRVAKGKPKENQKDTPPPILYPCVDRSLRLRGALQTFLAGVGESCP